MRWYKRILIFLPLLIVPASPEFPLHVQLPGIKLSCDAKLPW
jgi:hypothetical protein